MSSKATPHELKAKAVSIQFTDIAEPLAARGLNLPGLNILKPNSEAYQVLAIQPLGEISENDSVRHANRDLATKKLNEFIELALEKSADLVLCPEYSCPWEVLEAKLRRGKFPAAGKLWALCCESVSPAKFAEIKASIQNVEWITPYVAVEATRRASAFIAKIAPVARRLSEVEKFPSGANHVMKKYIFIVSLILMFATGPGFGQESMTPARFREIVNLPGDTTPLVSQLAVVPFWTNAVVSNVMTYASGKVFREVMTGAARTVGGKYVVFTENSQFYNQPMNGILAFDQKAAALKVYGLYGDGHGGDVVTEGTVVYDYAKKTYTITSSYGDGFKETTSGSYTGTEDFAKTVVYKSGALFLTRETTTWPVSSNKPASP